MTPHTPLSIDRRTFTRLAALALAATRVPSFAQPPADKPVGFAAIGLGTISDIFMRACAKTQTAKITALVTGHPETKGKKYAAMYGIPETSIYTYETYGRLRDNKDVDAVYVGLPNSMHREYTVRAAQMGKHVLCEKPMAISSAECTTMIDACRAANVKLMIAYRIHYEPTHLEAKRLIDSDAIGQIQSFEGSFGFNATPNQWRLTRQYGGGGPLMDVGIYPMNEIRWLTGEEPAAVTAVATTRDRSSGRFAEVEQTLNWTMKFPSGIVAALGCTYGASMPGFLRIHGDKGSLLIENAYNYTGPHLTNIGGGERVDTATQGDQTLHFQLEAEHFAHCIRTNTTPKTPGEEGLHDLLAIESIYKAAGTPDRMIARPASLRALALLLAACLCTAQPHAQTLDVTPTRVMADEPATIHATALQPHEHVTLQADLIDGAGAPWAAQADFVADDAGVIDTSKQAPTKGSYRIVSAMGLVWSMTPTAKDVHGYRPPRDFGTQTIHFHLLQNGRETANAQLEQTFLGEGVRQVKLSGELHGTLFLPASPGPHPGVLVVGGSEGGLSPGKAAWLASHGYAALALAYFRFPGLPNELANIPLEYFGQALAWMKQRPDIDPARLAVMGTSRGGELALQLGSMYPDIKAVVAYVPANVRYPSCCNRDFRAAWTWKGQGLAFVRPTSRGPVDPSSREATAAAIPVELTHGPILVISGEDDGIWSSTTMTDAVIDRLKRARFSYPSVHLNYPHAGHRAGNPVIIPTWSSGVTQPLSGEQENYGGNPEGNALSSLDAIPKVLEFLQQSLSTPHQ